MVNPHQSSEEPTALGLVGLADVQPNRGWFIGLGLLVGIDLVFSGSSMLLIGLGAGPVVRVTP